MISDHHLDLSKSSADDIDPVKGQIIVSLMSRDGKYCFVCFSHAARAFLIVPSLFEIPGPSGSGNPLVVVGPGGDIMGPTDERETTQSSNEHQVRARKKFTKMIFFILIGFLFSKFPAFATT